MYLSHKKPCLSVYSAIICFVSLTKTKLLESKDRRKPGLVYFFVPVYQIKILLTLLPPLRHFEFRIDSLCVGF